MTSVLHVSPGVYGGASNAASPAPAGPAARFDACLLQTMAQALAAAAPGARSDAMSRREHPCARAPVHIHADWSATGVHLWLGLDQHLAPQAESIAERVREWMRAEGIEVEAITCNGQPMPAPAAQEQAWPSVR